MAILMSACPVGSENHEKRSLPERDMATEDAVRGVGLPVGSGIREIRSLPDGAEREAGGDNRFRGRIGREAGNSE